jgi:hypothetical protein
MSVKKREFAAELEDAATGIHVGANYRDATLAQKLADALEEYRAHRLACPRIQSVRDEIVEGPVTSFELQEIVGTQAEVSEPSGCADMLATGESLCIEVDSDELRLRQSFCHWQ